MEINVTVQGAGDSLWGKSSGVYRLTEVVEAGEVDGDFASVNVYGKNISWVQYTDSEIPRFLLTAIRSVLEQMFGRKIKSLTWSEQGMQPEQGWNFDITLGRKIQ